MTARDQRILERASHEPVHITRVFRPAYEALPFPWVEGQIVLDGEPVVILNNPMVL